jgi:hypothetical protein
VQLATADLLDVQEILTSEINFSIFMMNVIALKISLLVFMLSMTWLLFLEHLYPESETAEFS